MKINENLHVSISIGTIIKTVCVLIGAWFLFVLRDVALIVFTAVVISSAVEPGVRAIVRYNVPRVAAVLALYLFLFLMCFILVYFFFPSVLKDFATFASSLPSYLETITSSNAYITYSSILGLPPAAALSGGDVIESLRNLFNMGASSDAISTATRIFGGVVSFVLIVVFSFYFAVVETGVDDFLRIITPRHHRAYVLDLWKRSQHKIGLWMQGQLILGVLIGVLVYLSLLIFQVPHALVLAVIAALFELIPVFGPILAAVPAIAIGFVSGGPVLGITVAVIYILIQQFENHLIYPQVVTRVVGVPPLLVILALIIGGELAGLLGVILSVPVAATLQELVKDIESGRFAKREGIEA
jgi:predicted PurR-regulated permease PerM